MNLLRFGLVVFYIVGAILVFYGMGIGQAEKLAMLTGGYDLAKRLASDPEVISKIKLGHTVAWTGMWVVGISALGLLVTTVNK